MIWILTFILVWNATPLVILWCLDVPKQTKLAATVSLITAGAKGLCVIIPSMLAPIVVPFALMQTKYEDNTLPAWARWWDNDVSINGDQPPGVDTYYAPGHDRRSFWARYVWLGWRNRASWLAQSLGHTWLNPAERTHWGDPLTGRDHEGWTLNVGDFNSPVYQLYIVKRLPFNLCYRLNYGYKVWAGYDNREKAMVVNISASVLRFTGA